MKQRATQTDSIIMGVVFFIISLSLPVIGMMPNEALAQTPMVSVAAEASQGTEKGVEEIQNVLAEQMGHFKPEDIGSDVLIPILAILLIFGMPPLVIIVLIVAYYHSRKRAALMRAETVTRLIEADREVPQSLLLGEEPSTHNPQQLKHHGVRNVAVGLGLVVCLGVIISWKAGTVGLVLIGLGVAQLYSARSMSSDSEQA